jgi:type IV pilus assembly protein PilW
MTQRRSAGTDQFPHKASLKSLPSMRQRGFTMVELLVALVISLLITLAAVAALTVSRQGFNTVDASSQLRDNIRFITDLMQRLGMQSGFKDTVYAAALAPPSVAGISADPVPNITGLNNTLLTGSNLTPSTRVTTVEGFGSDVLFLRYQTPETFPGSGISDKSMIDCAGNTATAIAAERYDRMVSVIHVAVSQGEPSLMCSYSADGLAPFSTQPIIQGVENFQVLYGVQGVSAGVAPPAIAASAATAATDSAPDSYLRADQMTVIGDTAGTNANWRRVRSLRIGMVVRGPANSAQDKVSQTLYPFGLAKSASAAAEGSAMSNTAALDPGTVFTPAVDGRLRRVATFTVHLRNDQGL